MAKLLEYTPTLSPRFVAYIRDYLIDNGIEPLPFFKECGLETDSGEEHDAPLPVDQVACLLERASVVTNNPSIGLSMGKHFHYETSSLLIVAMLAAPSVRVGLQHLAHYDKYVDPAIQAVFKETSEAAYFYADLLHDESHTMVQLNEYLMSFLVKTLMTATRQKVPVLSVSFRHTDNRNEIELSRFFGVTPSYGAEHNQIAIELAFLDQSFLTSNRPLFKILTSAVKSFFSTGTEHHRFVDMVCRQISLLDPDSVSTDEIASKLNISPRTLRRRLADEGLTFQEVRALARQQRAKFLLANTNTSLTEIAYELGYSELSAFSRAFRSWVGETPQAYRESVRELMKG
jgi:AraC-like DNA-binding protein